MPLAKKLLYIPTKIILLKFYIQVALGILRSLKMGLSTPTPIALRPLSTYMTAPVMAEANGDARKAAVFPTSSAHKSIYYFTILIIIIMMNTKGERTWFL